jgi:hypothetical protein
MDVLREVISTDYLKSIDEKFEKVSDSLHYVSIGKQSSVDFPYGDVKISEWDEINNSLCYFNLDSYGVVQEELDKSISDPCYRSHLLDISLYNVPISQGANWTRTIRNIM